MKAAQVLAVLGFVGASVAQSLHPDLPPAPTESVGCEPQYVILVFIFLRRHLLTFV